MSLPATIHEDLLTFPSDWPQPAMACLDKSLRCPICDEYFHAAMILSACAHSFCSLCIRMAIKDTPAQGTVSCPQCRAALKNGLADLKHNHALDEVVAAFTVVRSTCLVMFSAANSGPSPTMETGCQTVALNDREGRADVLGDEEDHIIIFPNSIDSSNQTESGGRITRRKRSAQAATSSSHAPASKKKNLKASVECPLCFRQTDMHLVNEHIDSGCTKFIIATASEMDGVSLSSKASTSSLVSPSLSIISGSRKSNLPAAPAKKHKAGIAYKFLNDAQLRKVLISDGLPTAGNREVMERRHKQYLILYNANVDSPTPVSDRVLLQRVDAWERSARSATVPDLGKMSQADKEGHAEKYKDQFEFMILAQKARMAKARAAESSSSNGESDVVSSDAMKPPVAENEHQDVNLSLAEGPVIVNNDVDSLVDISLLETVPMEVVASLPMSTEKMACMECKTSILEQQPVSIPANDLAVLGLSETA